METYRCHSSKVLEVQGNHPWASREAYRRDRKVCILARDRTREQYPLPIPSSSLRDGGSSSY